MSAVAGVAAPSAPGMVRAAGFGVGMVPFVHLGGTWPSPLSRTRRFPTTHAKKRRCPDFFLEDVRPCPCRGWFLRRQFAVASRLSSKTPMKRDGIDGPGWGPRARGISPGRRPFGRGFSGEREPPVFLTAQGRRGRPEEVAARWIRRFLLCAREHAVLTCRGRTGRVDRGLGGFDRDHERPGPATEGGRLRGQDRGFCAVTGGPRRSGGLPARADGAPPRRWPGGEGGWGGCAVGRWRGRVPGPRRSGCTAGGLCVYPAVPRAHG